MKAKSRRRKKNPTEHGGEDSAGKRKRKRPISLRKPMHVVMRAECARGELSLLHASNVRRVDALVRRMAQRFEVRILQYANSGNHLHILIHARRRESIQNFLRAAAGSIARVLKKVGKFWDYLAFSVVVKDWRENFRRVRRYIIRNILEAQRLIPYDRESPLPGILRLGPAPRWSWRSN